MAKDISELLDEIKHKELVLPEFQREFTWNRSKSSELLNSLFKGYPTGSLLIWKTDDPPKIKNDAYDLEKVRRVKVLLDGQQRLTSLYINRFGEVPPYYDEEEIPDGFFDLFFNLKNGIFKYYSKKQMENDPYWKPVIDLFNKEYSVFDLVQSVEDTNIDNTYKEVESNLNKLKNILDQEYPVQYVPTDADTPKAIEVFDLINSQGSRLNEADIILAYMTSNWPDIRRKLKEKISEMEENNFEFSLTFMIRCMVAITEGIGDLSSYGESTEEKLKEGWNKLDIWLDYLASWLTKKANIYSTKDLNSTYVLVPLITYVSKHGAFDEEEERKFLYWMYGSLYKRRYTSNTDTTLHQDITSLLKEPGPQSLIANLKEEEGDPEVSPSNFDTRGVGHPLYEMMVVVLRDNEAVDWSNGLPMTENVGDQFNIERHHIFPVSVLKDAGYETSVNQLDKKRVHEIANRIPLTKSGNLDIFDQKPEEYLPEVVERYPKALDQSLIPKNRDLWKVENYEDFLAKRRELIADAINDFMETLLEGQKEEKTRIKDLITQDENEKLEFKSTLRKDMQEKGIPEKILEKASLKTLAGMSNSRQGGKLIIGVDDDGGLVGLKEDYQTLGKGDQDGFENHFTNIISQRLGDGMLPFIDVDFSNINGSEVCVVDIDPCPRPVVYEDGDEEKYFVRFGNSTRELGLQDAEKHMREHFPEENL
jgi:hypothetical protein